MKKRNMFVKAGRAAMMCCVCLLAVVLSGCSFGTLSSRSLENPKQAIVDFIDAMQAENFDEEAAAIATKYVGNYSTMGFDKYALLEEDSLEKTLFDMLRSSYEVEFADDNMEKVSSPYNGEDMNISGKKAYVTVSFTSLNMDAMSEPLAEAVSEIGAERAYDGEVYDTEESALALVEEVFPTIFKKNNIKKYCVERELTVELTYHDDGWKLSVSDELYDALLGR